MEIAPPAAILAPGRESVSLELVNNIVPVEVVPATDMVEPEMSPTPPPVLIWPGILTAPPAVTTPEAETVPPLIKVRFPVATMVPSTTILAVPPPENV